MEMKKIVLIFILISVFMANLSAQKNEQLYAQGRKLFKTKNYRKAANTFSTLINTSSYYYEAYMYRARCYHAMQMEDSALLDFNTSLEKNPKYLAGFYYRGVYFFEMKKYSHALTDFSSILKTKRNYSKALSYRGQTYEAMGKDDLALSDYSKAIASGTKYYDVYYRRALLYKKQNRLKPAAYDLRMVLKLKPDFQKACSLRGVIEVERGRYAESLKDLNKAVSMDSEDEAALTARARAYVETEQFDKALADYNILVKHFHTRNTEVYLQRGRLFVSQGEFTKAQKDFSRILVINPRNSEACTENAKVYLLKNRVQQSIPVATKAIGFDKKNWEAYYVRGKAYFLLKKWSEGLKDLNTSIDLHPTADAYFYRGQCRAEKGDKLGACADLKQAEKMGSELVLPEMLRLCR